MKSSNALKTQRAKFTKGTIVTREKNNFQRFIVDVYHQERSGVLKVMYEYHNELLNEKHQPTGDFDHLSLGTCSQDHLLSWIKGKR